MTRTYGIWFILLLTVFPRPGEAQVVRRLQTNRGWIGISIDFTSAVLPGDTERTVAVIKEVVRGSPAQVAGIQVGDTLTHLDGQPISEGALTSLVRTLEVGDLVRMTVVRGTRPREVLVEAGPQDQSRWILAPDAHEMVLRLDSVRGAILHNLDSLRVSIEGVRISRPDSTGTVSIRIVKPTPKGEEGGYFDLSYRFREPFLVDSFLVAEPFLADSLKARAGVTISSMELALPFGAYVVATEETEPLRAELKRIRKELTEVRRQELSRIRELQAAIQGPVEEIAQTDERIRQLKAQEEALVREQQEVTYRLQEISEEAIQREFSEMQTRQEEGLAAALRERQRSVERSRDVEGRQAIERARLIEEYESRRPTWHITVGQSFVAGAQLTPLNSALAEYFQVDEGVLVTEVLDGTPAEAAGLTAGDVIVQVGTEVVSSLDDLRFGVAYLERPLRLRVVRKGSTVEIVIRK